MKTIDQVFAEWESVGVVTPRTQVMRGRKYLCLVSIPSERHGAYKFPKALIPFLHSDSDIGPSAAVLHYHIDSRFMALDELNVLSGSSFRYTHGRQPSIEKIHSQGFPLRLDVMQMVCRRVQPTGLPLCSPDAFNLWAEKYTGRPCKGKKCPHWGAPMTDRGNGLLECPMHGLFGSTVTERIISRYEATVIMHKGDPCELR